MIESKMVNEWKAEGQTRTLLRVLRRRFGPLPSEVEKATLSCTDAARIDAWVDAAVTVTSLDEFRREVGL